MPKKSVTLVLPAVLSGFRSRVDSSYTLSLETQELSPDALGILGQCLKRAGVFVFKPDKESLSEEELKAIQEVDIRITEPGKKSKSQLLRDILYRNFEHNPEGFTEFDTYYVHYMAILINHFKKKIQS